MESSMFELLSSSHYFQAALALVVVGLLLGITGFAALMRAQIGSFTLKTLFAIFFLLIGGLAGMVALGMPGYKTLTKEEVAAKISVSPIASQRFAATLKYPDGRTANYMIAGDEIYVDAHILKWHPLANFFGLHTAYELDRIGGRYRDIEQERTAERTLIPLSLDKSVNIFSLRQRHTFLAPLLDAKYGSAAFVPVIRPAELELRVSTTGLLIRELELDQSNP